MKFSSVIFVLITLISCRKDKTPLLVEEVVIQPYVKQDCITVGDSVSNNIHFTNINPDITQVSYDFTTYTDLDINSDGISDFQFSVLSAYPFAGNWFNGCTVKIKSLTPSAQICKDSLYADSSYFYPHLYEENDLIKQNSFWDIGEMLISANGDDPSDTCYGPNCPNISYGSWFGQSNKYIGIRLNGTSMGWIKISLPSTNVDWGQSLHILEYGIID